MRALIILVCIVTFLPGSMVRGADAPDWLKTLGALPTPAMAAKAPAVVLLDESVVEVDAKGVATEVHRVAIRILHNSGGGRAFGRVAYIGGSDKVLSVGAWLVRKSETIESRKKNDWVDLATGSAGAVIDEQRTMAASLSDKAIAGDLFGYETRLQSPMLVAQWQYAFGSDLPILTERLQLTLPAGFALDAKIYGPIPPVQSVSSDRRTWTWSMTDRPYRPTEPFEIPSARADAELLLRIQPPAGTIGFLPHTFANWADVVTLYSKLNGEQCDSSPALEAKVHELIASDLDELGKIRALGAHVQKLRYVAINTGLSRGFGWKARKASVVFSNGYGDCKDKANLLVAMLRHAGIRAHLVIAFLGKEREVKADCPTPAQFNHAIVAIEVGEKVQLPSVVADAKLGRLLIFDPTDPYTQVGDISGNLQGSLVHVEAPGNDALTTLPVFLPQDDFKIVRRMTMTLTSEGAVTVAGRVSAAGQTGASLRAQFERANLPKDVEQLVTKQLNDKFRGAIVQDKKTEDDRLSGQATLVFSCVQPNYLQWLQGRTAIVKLDILSRHYLPNFSEKERALPIYLPPLAIDDEIVFTVPTGFQVDELPAPTVLESTYGSCRMTYETIGEAMVLKRVVVLNQSTIPVADYAKLRQFLGDIAKADRTSLLLKRQG